MITVKQRLGGTLLPVLVVLVCLVWVKGARLAESTESSEGAERSPLAFTEVRPGVFVHQGVHADMTVENRGDIANIGFIVGEDSVAVIDPGASPDISRQLQSAVQRLAGLPVSHVILTHLHPDHVLGVAAFADEVTVVAHENYTRALVQRGTFYLDRFADLLGVDQRSLRPPDQTVAADDTLTIDLGGRLLDVRAYRVAHTDNDLSVHDPDAGVLWASDLLFESRIPSLDGSLVGWLLTLEQIARQYRGSLAIPGHGQPGPLEPMVARQKQYLETLLEQIRQGIADNLRLSAAVERIGQSQRANWELFDLHHRGNVSKAWSELEWK